MMLLPASLLIGLVSIYPFLSGISMAFTNYDVISHREPSFVGISNFLKLLTSDKEFYSILKYTLIYTLSVTIISYVVGFYLALLLNKDLKGRAVARALILVVWVLPSIVAGYSWRWLLNTQGLINALLLKFQIVKEPIGFLLSSSAKQITCILFGTWKSFPFMTLVLLAGLQTIPRELYEAAQMDGSMATTSFRYITFPLMRQITLVSTILMIIWTFNNFEDVYLIMGGYPTADVWVLSILTYYTAFTRHQMSYAASIAVFMMFALTICMIFYRRLVSSK